LTCQTSSLQGSRRLSRTRQTPMRAWFS